MRTTFALAAVAMVALLGAGQALAAATPRGAAAKAAACFRAHGWTVTLEDGRTTVAAEVKRSTPLGHPNYSVSFFRPYPGAKMRATWAQFGLSRAELKVAQSCRAAGLR